MGSVLRKAMKGLGTGVAQVSLIQLQDQVAEMREKRLQEFKKSNQPKFSKYGEISKNADGSTVYGQTVEGTGEVKGAQIVKAPKTKDEFGAYEVVGEDKNGNKLWGQKNLTTGEMGNITKTSPPGASGGKVTKSDRQLVLAGKISQGKATKEEQSEYFLLVNADPIQQMRMQMGMNVPSAGDGNATVTTDNQNQVANKPVVEQSALAPLTDLQEGRTVSGPNGEKSVMSDGVIKMQTADGWVGWVDNKWVPVNPPGSSNTARPASAPANQPIAAQPQAPAQPPQTGIEGLKTTAQIDEEKRLASPEYQQGIIDQNIASGQQAFNQQRGEMADRFGLEQMGDARTGAEYGRISQAYTEVNNLINQGILPEDVNQINDALQFAQGANNTVMVTKLQAILQRLEQ